MPVSSLYLFCEDFVTFITLLYLLLFFYPFTHLLTQKTATPDFSRIAEYNSNLMMLNYKLLDNRNNTTVNITACIIIFLVIFHFVIIISIFKPQISLWAFYLQLKWNWYTQNVIRCITASTLTTMMATSSGLTVIRLNPGFGPLLILSGAWMFWQPIIRLNMPNSLWMGGCRG